MQKLYFHSAVAANAERTLYLGDLVRQSILLLLLAAFVHVSLQREGRVEYRITYTFPMRESEAHFFEQLEQGPLILPFSIPRLFYEPQLVLASTVQLCQRLPGQVAADTLPEGTLGSPSAALDRTVFQPSPPPAWRYTGPVYWQTPHARGCSRAAARPLQLVAHAAPAAAALSPVELPAEAMAGVTQTPRSESQWRRPSCHCSRRSYCRTGGSQVLLHKGKPLLKGTEARNRLILHS